MRAIGSVLVGVLLAAGMPSTSALGLPQGTEARVWATGLNSAIHMAWVPGTNKVFVTQKGGAIRVIKGGTVLDRPCARLDVNQSGERGLLGLALHPRFKSNHYLYVYYTNRDPLDNRVARFKVRNDRCRDRKVIVKGLDADSSGYHNGGQIEFVNGKLFVAVGDAHDPARAQNTGAREGKILRVNPDGSIPSDNPFGNAVWSYGHRNPFGLTSKPGSGRIYSSENGPSCDDELNLIKRGRNYGWGPGYDCGTRGVGEDPKGPLVRWGSIIVPTDPGWYSGRMKALSGDLYMGDFGNGDLHRFVMNDRGTRVRDDRVIHNAGAPIVDVAEGPGGWLYYVTFNAIYRIVKT
ncbi:MAG: PQQ-dependent sugar dehydrogenase [Actinomycetota bacterium]